MNGMALHGGLIPYGGTFLVFTDYCRASIRLSALMGLPVVYVMTHDSIGLGEDGPTHQPVEHLASLRAIPNLSVFRPADPIETAECWALALSNRTGPSVLALSRQGTPVVREATTENLSSRGGYVLAPASGERQATILSTGTEIPLALEARRNLEAAGIPTAVVSMVSWELSSRRNQKATGQAFWARVPRGWRSRQRPCSAGAAMSRARTMSSACGASAPRRRPRNCTHISASPPRRGCSL